MRLSAELLKEELSEYVILWAFDSRCRELCLERPEYYIDQPRLLPGHLYIAYADQLPEKIEHSPDACLICIGEPSDHYLEGAMNVLIVSQNLRPQLLFNLLHRIFNRFDQWDYSLQECLSNDSSLQAILDICDSVIENPIYIIDAKYELLAFSRKTDSLVRSNSSTTILHELKEEPLYKTLFESKEPVIYSSGVLPQRSYSYIIRDGSEFILGIAVNEVIRPFKNTDGALILHLSNYLRTYYRRHLKQDSEIQPRFIHMARQLLDREYVNPQTMSDLLWRYHWEPGGTLLVCSIALGVMEQDYQMGKLVLRQVRSAAGNAQVFEYQNYIVVLFYSNSKKKPFTEPESFRQKLQDLKLHYGVSEEFSELAALRIHFLESIAAAETGEKKRPDKLRHTFDEHRMDYMLQCCRGSLEPQSLCSPNLLSMLEYDQRHHTEFTKTLRIYISLQFNASQSARMLAINRSSFLQRLEKIKDYFGISLSGFDDILYTMLQLKLMENDLYDGS